MQPGSLTPWRVGIPGGIPSYPNCVNVVNYGAHGDGINDDSPAFISAMAACTNGGAVYAPAGVYRLNKPLNFTSSKRLVIRGAGASQTRLVSYATTYPFVFGGDSGRTSSMILAGFTRGSTNLALSTTTGLVAGQLCRMYQNDDPGKVFGSFEGSGPHQGQSFRIYSVSGNSINTDRPIYYGGYNSNFSPRLEAFTSACDQCGLEDVGVLYNGTADNTLYFYVSQRCWLLRVNATNAVHATVSLNDSYQNVIHGCQFWYHQAYDSNARYGVGIGEYSSDCLVENNICEANNVAVICQYYASGNVVAYNFGQTGWTFSPGAENSANGIGSHGDNANFNLFEGNVVPWFSVDEFWGDNRSETAFRNWLRRWGWGDTNGTVINQGVTAVYLDSTNYFMNIVGNVLGTPRDIGDTNTSHYVWQIGYARRADNDPPAAPSDPNTAATAFTHGNYDYVTQTTSWKPGAPQALPASYYLTAKPAWFGSLAWPAIGPDVNTSMTITNGAVIPAQARFLGLSY